MEEIAPKKPLLDTLKTFSPATALGLLALVLFGVFCTIDTTAVRWWLMLPLAAAGCALFLWRRTRAAGLEARLCSLGVALLLALVVLRDIGLSRKLAELLDTLEQYQTQIDEATTAIDRFFQGSR